MGARLAQVARAYARVVASPTYVPLRSGQLTSNFADTLRSIALVVLVFQLTGQGFRVAGVAADEVVPVLVPGPVAGVVIDRFSRRLVLIAADLFRRRTIRFQAHRASGGPSAQHRRAAVSAGSPRLCSRGFLILACAQVRARCSPHGFAPIARC